MTIRQALETYLNSDSAYPYVSFTFTGDTFIGWQDDMQLLVTGLFADTLTIEVIDRVAKLAIEASEKEGHDYSGMVFIPGGGILGGIEREYAHERDVIVAVCQPLRDGSFIHILESAR